MLLTAQQAVLDHLEIYNGVASGKLVPEDPSTFARPRRYIITIVHVPHYARAFLASRQPRVADRLTPLLQRRRRTRLPAEVRVPKRSLRGRAPPLSSTCSL